MSIPIMIVMIFGYILNIYIEEVSYLNFLVKVALYSIAYGILLWFMGLNNYEKSQIYIWKK